MTEIDVMLTDYGLMIFCFILSCLIRWRGHEGFSRKRFEIFYGVVALASFFGGTLHGFFLNENSWMNKILSPLTLTSIGVAAFQIWTISARMLFDEKGAKLISNVMLGLLFIYCIVTLKMSLIQDYLAAIVYYLPATVALLGALLRKYLKNHEKEILLGIIGIFLTFVAAGIQQAEIGISPLYLSFNALYHLVQAVGLYLLYLCALYLTKVDKN